MRDKMHQGSNASTGNREDYGKQYEDVAILFCFIMDFDTIMKEEGQEIVPLLDKIFRDYDLLCDQHGVQKIEV